MHYEDNLVDAIFSETSSMLSGSGMGGMGERLMGGSQGAGDRRANSSSEGSSETTAADESYVKKVRYPSHCGSSSEPWHMPPSIVIKGRRA